VRAPGCPASAPTSGWNLCLIARRLRRQYRRREAPGQYDRGAARGGEFAPRVRLSTRNQDDRVEVRIRDNGEGIPAAIRDKVFAPFFTKPTGAGTGLGLSISYDIVVHEHHGELRVETKEGEFTEFVITLPRRAR
jgi:signal transduction histidine kinase